MRSLAIILFCLMPQLVAAAPQKRCLYINAYHDGYAWSDGIRKALFEELHGVCTVREELLDSKLHPEPEFLKQRARAIMQVVRDWKPDIVIASDDNSIRWVVQPWLRNSGLPVVFCGLNWSMDEYELPYANTTGMIEVAPIRPLFRQVKRIVRPATHALYIDTDNLTGRKDLERHQRVGSQLGIQVDSRLVRNLAQWKAALAAGQDHWDQRAHVFYFSPGCQASGAKTAEAYQRVYAHMRIYVYAMLDISEDLYLALEVQAVQ